MKGKWLVLFFAVLLVAGCSEKWNLADRPQIGPKGPAGTHLIKEQLMRFNETNNLILKFPEITSKREKTFVRLYQAPLSDQTNFSPMSDDWLGSISAQTFSVSWSAGQIYLCNVNQNNVYLIQIFSRDGD